MGRKTYLGPSFLRIGDSSVASKSGLSRLNVVPSGSARRSTRFARDELVLPSRSLFIR